MAPAEHRHAEQINAVTSFLDASQVSGVQSDDRWRFQRENRGKKTNSAIDLNVTTIFKNE